MEEWNYIKVEEGKKLLSEWKLNEKWKDGRKTEYMKKKDRMKENRLIHETMNENKCKEVRRK